MQLINRENPADQKHSKFLISLMHGMKINLDQKSGNLVRIQKVENFAKLPPNKWHSVLYLVLNKNLCLPKTGTQCTILAGYKNGVEVNQVYNVGIAKPIIHPLPNKQTGTTFTKIGLIKVVSTQADVATCEIIEDLGINTDVEPDKLLARLATNKSLYISRL